jgi:hypothetical protein
MLLLCGCRFMPIVLVQKPEEDFEVDRVVVVEVDNARVCFLKSSLERVTAEVLS